MDAIHSLGFRTDVTLLALQGSTIDERDGFRVIRTPANPGYHWGNFILLDGAPLPGTVAGWVDLFHREFPGVSHIAIGVDGTEGKAGELEEIMAEHLTVDRSTVLIASRLEAPGRGLSDGELRMLGVDSDEDWSAALELQQVNFPPTVDDDGEFARRKLAGMRELQARGIGAWFGAFVDGQMVSGLGIFSDTEGVARYQTVDTHPDFRTRGLAGSLVYLAGSHAVESMGAKKLVIVADPDYTAIRLYRALGFDGTESQVQLYSPRPEPVESTEQVELPQPSDSPEETA
jgi:ribosomal protein S18 acetylase RimI-like enzyme